MRAARRAKTATAMLAAALACALPSRARAQSDDEHPELRRSVLLPAAGTTPRGTFDVTVYEMAFPSVAYGVTDDVQIGVGGTWVPTSEQILMPGGKVRLASAGGLALSGIAALGMSHPDKGVPGWLPVFGIAGTFCGIADGKICVGGVVLSATPSSRRGSDRVLVGGVNAAWRVNRRLDVLVEADTRAVAPELQVGTTLMIAARAHFGRHTDVDVGWLIDTGIVGDAFPLLGSPSVFGTPGIPLLNLAFHLP